MAVRLEMSCGIYSISMMSPRAAYSNAITAIVQQLRDDFAQRQTNS
jgi:hypothetical protein